ncbi:MAG: NAD(+) synthase [Candidatus Woesearchaeota archaeon]|jgi:NAD+ synthase
MLEDKIKLAIMNKELVADEIGNFIAEQIAKRNTTGGVIGLSGGVDSTTTAALAKRGVDNYIKTHKDANLEIVGYILPSKTNAKADEEDGEKVAKRLGIRYEKQNIEPIVEAFKYTNPEAVENKFNKGNLMSRIRANVLHTKGASENKIVLGTGNKDEDFGLGYYTLFGDGAVHISPIGALPKRLVREMATYLGFADLANRIPTAGLEPGQTDFRDIGYDYDLAEIVIEGLHQGFAKKELVLHTQVKPLAEKQMKIYEQMYGTKKFNTVQEILDDVERRHKIAYAKGQLIQPPIPEVTLDYR